MWVASDLLRGTGVTHRRARWSCRTRSGCTRARRRSSSSRASRFAAAVTVDRGRSGRWTERASWACCCWPPRGGAAIIITATGPDEPAAIDGAGALVASGFGEDSHARLTGVGVVARAWASGRGRARSCGGAARCCAPGFGGARGRRGARDSSGPASSRRAAGGHPGARWPAAPAPDLAALFDAQLLMLDDPLLVARAADARARPSASTPNGPCSGPSTRWPGCSTGVGDPYLRERGGDVADVVGRLRMNLRGSAPRLAGRALRTARVRS